MHACVRIVYLYHITFINLFGYVFYVYFCSVTLLYLLVVAFLIFVRAFVYLYVISFLKPWVQRYNIWLHVWVGDIVHRPFNLAKDGKGM